ncbi:MAG: hypothetical protein J6C77_04590 [Muribaculaceae bacterium]|nr:hypothetical protein [Muribaculaceae bacterium]
MEDRNRQRRRRNTQMWLAIGAIVLVILLIVWLTEADLWGDTDVNAITSLLGA